MLVASLAAGCVNLGEGRLAARVGAHERCAESHRLIDTAVRDAGVQDGAHPAVPGFPYLRVSRFLASFANQAKTDAQFERWVGAMAMLDRDARRFELANLPPSAAATLDPMLRDTLECADALRQADLGCPRTRTLLRESVVVPDEYETWMRAAGLYPLTRWPFFAGLQAFQRGVATRYAMPIDRLPVAGKLVRFELEAGPRASPADVAGILAEAVRNPLGIPDLAPSALALLQRTYAPIFEVDVASDADRIGAPIRDGSDRPDVDVSRPTLYVRASHTRYRGRNLLQLVYSVWFRERPSEDVWFDLLSGRLDGITWRITLAPDGTPLVFDTVHNCGCYLMFYPTPAAQALPPVAGSEDFVEPPFLPQTLPMLSARDRLVIRVAAGTHYVERVSELEEAIRSDGSTVPLRFVDDDSLRSLARTRDGTIERRSLFGSDGIIVGTERGERYLFWPMGVREPGAMRQWGRHATAFVGRRHFDDAMLFERYFRFNWASTDSDLNSSE